MAYGVLRQIPLCLLDFRNIFPTGMYRNATYRFRCPAAISPKNPNPWDSCSWVSESTPDPKLFHQFYWHRRRGNCKESQDQDWTTQFIVSNNHCDCCLERFFRHLQSGKTQSPNNLVTAFVNLHLFGFVEYRYIDLEDGGSEWTYLFPYRFSSCTGI